MSSDRTPTAFSDTASVADDPYDRLPDEIKAVYSKTEWLWLSDRDKFHLEHELFEPEF